MYRSRNNGGFRLGYYEWDLDPAYITDAFKNLDIRYVNGRNWNYYIDIDPVERMKANKKTRAYLARYARIDPYTWDDKPIKEMYEYKNLISEIVSEENALSAMDENT